MSEPRGESVRMTDAFPENELPRWLLRKSLDYSRRAVLALYPPPYKRLAQFSHDLGRCAASSADIVRGLELCLKPLRDTRIGDRWTGAVDHLRKGGSMADALRPADDLLPPFFLPVIHAGEQSGRLDEAFRFLERHCNLLAGPAAALRNVWFYPVAILLAGALIRFLMLLLMGSVGDAFSFLLVELFSWLQLAVIVAIAAFTPMRYFVDQARLSIPLLGPLEREIALHRFFRVLALVYSVGGHRVEEMIRTAAQTVSNNAARLDLLRAATAIEDNACVTDAFRRVGILTQDEQSTIEVGEMSGTLEQVFERISDETGDSMVAKLNFIQPLLVRFVAAIVIFSILTTMFMLLMNWAN